MGGALSTRWRYENAYPCNIYLRKPEVTKLLGNLDGDNIKIDPK
jgi:hypothetical protein